jgi:hypothetical protein
MVSEFNTMMSNEDFITEANLEDPTNILSMVVHSVSKTIESQLEKTITDR